MHYNDHSWVGYRVRRLIHRAAKQSRQRELEERKVAMPLTKDRQLIRDLRSLGLRAKWWGNSGDYTPPADVNYRGELRVHTGVQPELIATDAEFKQAILRPTLGRYRHSDFLVGMDETANFVSRLPGRVSSVAEAHELLKPPAVKEAEGGVVRQGEWFFVPVGKAELDQTCTLHGQTLRKCLEKATLEPRQLATRGKGATTHHARSATVHGGVAYAKGLIQDNREGRHADLYLGHEWHKAIANTEQQLDTEPTRPRVRHFD
jgi:hypothetical protein